MRLPVLLASLCAVACQPAFVPDDENVPELHAEVALNGDEVVAQLDEGGASPVFELDRPVARLGLYWDAAAEGAIELRLSADGQGWSEWAAPEVVYAEGPVHAGHLERMPARYYQYRVPRGAAAPTYVEFDPVEQVAVASPTPPPEVDTLEQELAPNPTIHSRASWSTRSPTCITASTPFRATVHHTVGPNNDTATPQARLRSIQAFHMDSRGYCDIAYNFLISQDGRVWEGRGARRLGGHTFNENDGNVGISFMGTYSTRKATPTQLCGAGMLLAFLHRNWAAVDLNRTDVKGHRQYGATGGATECPGNALYAQLPEIIRLATNGCGAPDADGDGDPDTRDNCPQTPNPGQADTDKDKKGDACDLDDDGDGVADVKDNCPLKFNAEQKDTDGDKRGNACDTDDDGDKVLDTKDNCPLDKNPSQADLDKDKKGDACDPDDDADGVPDATDNCARVANPDQKDADGDKRGDACQLDDDADGEPDATDNCRLLANTDQADADGDKKGDACDADDDGDLTEDPQDNCPTVANADQADLDLDGDGDACDNDDDGDGLEDDVDNCAAVSNPGQEDLDGDHQGDACEDDRDGDGVPDATDNCKELSNTEQLDADGNGVGDACDSDEGDDGEGNEPEAAQPEVTQDLVNAGCAQSGLSLVGPALLGLLGVAGRRRRRV